MMLVVWVLLIIVLSIMGLMIYSLTRGSEWLPFVSRDIDESVDEHNQSQDDAVFHYFERKAGYEDIISLDDEDYYDEELPPDGLDDGDEDNALDEVANPLSEPQYEESQYEIGTDDSMEQDDFDVAVQEALYEIDGAAPSKAKFLREIDLQWPGSKVILQRIPLDSGVLFHWAGLSRNEHSILFVASGQEGFRVLMQCIQRICEDNVVPGNDAWILMADDERILDNAREEALSYFKAKHLECIVLEEGFGIDTLFSDGRDYALVGIGSKLSLTVGVQKNQASSEWLRSFSIDFMFPASMSSVTAESIAHILPSLSVGIRMQFTMKQRQVAENISQLSPQVRYWFRPEINVEEQNGYYILQISAMDDDMLDEAYDIIRQSIGPRIGITKIAEQRKAHVCDFDSEFLQMIQNAIEGSYRIEDIVPVLARGIDVWGDWDAYTFSPIVLSEAGRSMDAMIRFYYSLIV